MAKEKLQWKDWVEKYFEQPSGCDYFISKYEQCELGFAWSDLSHCTVADLDEEYRKYLANINSFWQYEE